MYCQPQIVLQGQTEPREGESGGSGGLNQIPLIEISLEHDNHDNHGIEYIYIEYMKLDEYIVRCKLMYTADCICSCIDAHCLHILLDDLRSC